MSDNEDNNTDENGIEMEESPQKANLDRLKSKLSARAKVMNKKFPRRPPPSGGEVEMDDKYAEAWYILGEPIFLPFIKFCIAISIFFADNFFLIKNVYNAIKMEEDPDLERNDAFRHPQIITACILGMHIFSSCLISIIDSLNKDAILGRRGKYLNRQHKILILCRLVAHLTLTMRLFRYVTSYLENRRRNKQLHTLRMRRAKVSEQEVQFVVDQKKNQLVESHYDLVDSFFKTVPAALLQVFFMFKANPNARLRLYTTTDVDRFATVLFSVISASISASLYQMDYLCYKKVLIFQDCFRSGFKPPEMSLSIPAEAFLVTNLPIQFATIGIRICFYSVLIFWDPKQFLITMGVLLVANWWLTFFWNKSAWRFRPVLENPLYGIPWISFDIIDLWINLFVPGVHYAKPLDLFLNFYSTTVVGVIIFGSFDFLFPTKTRDAPKHHGSHGDNSTVTMTTTTTTTTTMNPLLSTLSTTSTEHPLYSGALDLFNKSWTSQSSAVLENPDPESQPIESIFLITAMIKGTIAIHEYLTFSQISYAGFFYNVVKFMNVVNVVCFLYSCALNWLLIYDQDFPIQIVNAFYLKIFHHLSEKAVEPGQASGGGNNPPEYGPFLKAHAQSEVLLIFSLLRNSSFFYNVPTRVQLLRNWHSVDPELLEQLVKQLLAGRDPDHDKNDPCLIRVMDKVADIVSPWLYPTRFREPALNWDLSTEKDDIIAGLADHPLRPQLIGFVEGLYDNLNGDGQLLLAVFCGNYNEIVRHYTSLRVKRTFEFLDVPIDKLKPYSRPRTASGQKIRTDYEYGYWNRVVREVRGMRGKVESILESI